MTALRSVVAAEEWMRDGLCRGSDVDLWFPGPGESRDSVAAKAVCRQCAVADECLDYAITNVIIHGVWGGMSERQRQRMRVAGRQAS